MPRCIAPVVITVGPRVASEDIAETLLRGMHLAQRKYQREPEVVLTRKQFNALRMTATFAQGFQWTLSSGGPISAAIFGMKVTVK